MSDERYNADGALWISGSDLEDVYLTEDWETVIERTELGDEWAERRKPGDDAPVSVQPTPSTWTWVGVTVGVGLGVGILARYL